MTNEPESRAGEWGPWYQGYETFERSRRGADGDLEWQFLDAALLNRLSAQPAKPSPPALLVFNALRRARHLLKGEQR